MKKKLQMYGCNENTLKWISSYLTHRSQYTNIGRHNSGIVPTTRGVPQGSILGPLIFLTFTNDMASVVRDANCTNPVHDENARLFGSNSDDCGLLIMYADDACYFVSNKSRVQNQLKINVNLAKLENYLNDNELALNIGKTSIMECMTRQKRERGRLEEELTHLVVQTKPGVHKRINGNPKFRSRRT